MIVSKHHVTEEQMNLEEKQILAAQANPQKFAVLYEKYFEGIFNCVYHRMDDMENSRDITQQVFIKALKNIHSFKQQGFPFSSWLYRIAINEVNQYYRDSKKTITVNIESNRVYDIIDSLEEDSLEQYHDQLIKEMGYLPEDEIQLLQMRFFEKRSFREIGEIINITENNAKVRTYRLLDKLKASLTRIKK
jgi:RNA polymerase sigma-70 factor (ECF subfamily)